jgi:hypothetical protein
MGPGRYHGFPEKPRLIPPKMKPILRDRARSEGCEEEFDDWLEQEDL